MLKAKYVLPFALLVMACDPVVYSTLRLEPAKALAGAPADTSTHAASQQALDALESIVLRFGLTREISSESRTCPHAWRGPQTLRRPQFLSLCARESPTGRLDVRVAEVLTSRWSAQGDSLRRAITDTLARFGKVEVVSTP